MISQAKTFDSKTLREAVLEMAFAGSTVHIGCAFFTITLNIDNFDVDKMMSVLQERL